MTRVALLGASPVDRVIVNFFVGERTPPRPTRFFTSREDALAWLRSSALAEADAGAEGIQDGNR
ncbi:hypothetical protein [Arthrobacter sp. 92]|uniref:DUF7793 family protein n=1 Tax=Arthrobacter sp. 92 TaxID=3418175 RepID=UPI003D041169